MRMIFQDGPLLESPLIRSPKGSKRKESSVPSRALAYSSNDLSISKLVAFSWFLGMLIEGF